MLNATWNAFGLAILVFGQSIPWAAQFEGAPPLAAVSNLVSNGSQFIRLTLERPADVIGIELRGSEAGVALAMESGDGSGWMWAFQGFGEGISVGLPKSMPAGDYHAYLVSADGRPATAVLQLSNLTGETTLVMDGQIRSRMGPLDRNLPDVLPNQGVDRFRGDQPFDGYALTGFYVVSRSLVAFVAEDYLRWETPEGVYWCSSSGVDPLVSTGTLSSMRGSLIPWGPDSGGRTTLTFYRYGAKGVVETHVAGVWIERAPDAPPHETVEERVLFLDLPESADYDSHCLQYNLPHHLSSILPADFNNAVFSQRAGDN